MKTINDNSEQISEGWDNLIKGLYMFTDDFVDEESDHAEQGKKEGL